MDMDMLYQGKGQWTQEEVRKERPKQSRTFSVDLNPQAFASARINRHINRRSILNICLSVSNKPERCFDAGRAWAV